MKTNPDVLCAECELPYRHHDAFERCLFVAHEQYFRVHTWAEWSTNATRAFYEKIKATGNLS